LSEGGLADQSDANSTWAVQLEEHPVPTTQPPDDEVAQYLDLRYGGQPRPETILWNDEIRTMLRHKSVRNYLPDPLPEGALETIVAAAQSASTASNLHQWSVVAVSDPEIKARVGELVRLDALGMGQPYVDEAPVILLWVADMSRNHAIVSEAGGNPEVLEYLDSFLMASVDTAIAAQNAAIAAESLALGTVFIGAARNKAKELAELIRLPDYSFVVCGLVVGHPDPARPTNVRPRPTQGVVLHHNHYDAVRSARELDLYEGAFLSFRESSEMMPKTWRDAVRFATSDVETMDGRQNLRETLQDRGFKLL
jgi:nitroreductase